MNSILDLRLYQLTALENDKISGEYAELLVRIKDYLDILANESRVLGIVKDELKAIKDRYATPRVTRIIPFSGDMAIEDLIPNDTMIVTITHSGYIKRTNSAEYRVQARGGKGVKAATTRGPKGRRGGLYRTPVRRPEPRLPDVLYEHRARVRGPRL